MARPATIVKQFLKSISPEDARAVAKLADTSVPHLRHIAAGRRNMSCELAWSLAEASSAHFGARSKFSLDQTELCAACGKRARKSAAK